MLITIKKALNVKSQLVYTLWFIHLKTPVNKLLMKGMFYYL